MRIESLGFALLLLLPVDSFAQTTRTSHADTTFLLVKGNGAWGAPRTAVEVLRIGGSSRKESTFGDVGVVRGTADGGVVVYDRKSLDGPMVRMFDGTGKFVRNVGRVGSGPGEYRAGIDIQVGADGRIWLTDISNSRINVYSPKGDFLTTFRVPGYMWTIDMLRLGQRGDIYMVAPIFPPKGSASTAREQRGYFRIDTVGRVLDTIRPAAMLGGGEDQTLRAAILSDGRMVTAASDRVGFTISQAGAGKGVTVVARDLPLVRVSGRERNFIDSSRKAMDREMPRGEDGRPVAYPPIPEFKPPYGMLKVGSDGRIWLQRSVADAGKGPLITPAVFDGFEANGTFLGQVTLPGMPRTSTLAFGAEIVWAVLYGEDDEISLVKYRIK